MSTDDDSADADVPDADADQSWMDRRKALFTTAKNDGEGSDEWGTPGWIWRPLSEALNGFDLDPASGAERNPIADEQFTGPPDGTDGLSEPWHGDVWVNPPFSDMGDWTEKARNEARRDEVDTVWFLMPNRSATGYYHNDFIQEAALKVEFQGRVDFDTTADNGGSGAPFPVIIVVFGDPPDIPDDVFETLDHFGQVFLPLTDWQSRQATFGRFSTDA